MSARVVAVVALGLWVITIAVGAFFFIRGRTVPLADGRSEILLAPGERELVLKEMRGMLTSVQGVVGALRERDMKKVADAARTSGMAAMVDVSPQLMAKLPLDFKALGVSVHQSFDQLAAAAGKGISSDDVLGRLSVQLSACVACHSRYRLLAAPSSGGGRRSP